MPMLVMQENAEETNKMRNHHKTRFVFFRFCDKCGRKFKPVGRFAILCVKCSKSKYKTKDKRLLLCNCVKPELGLHVFNMAFKEKQKTL